MHISLRFIFFIFILLLIPCLAFSGIKNAVEYDFSAESIHRFISHLISKDEFYRAYVELKRLNSYYPGYLQEEKSYVTELYLLFNGEKYFELLNNESICSNFNIRAIHDVFKTDVFIKNSEFLNARAILESTGLSSINKDVEFYLYKRTILSYILLKKIDDAKSIFYNKSKNYEEFEFNEYKLNELIDYSETTLNSLKNPYSAILLGVIPGMGYTYSGQIETGIIAFILISAMSAVTYFSFRTDNKPIGVFFGLATTFFYGGSIIGGYMGAKSYNRSAAEDLRDSLSQRMELSADREKILNEYGVTSVGK